MINQYSLDACVNVMNLLKVNKLRLVADQQNPVGLLNIATNRSLITQPDLNDEDFYQQFAASTAKPVTVAEGAGFYDPESPAAGILEIDDYEATLVDLRNMVIQRTQGLSAFARGPMQSFIDRVLKGFQPKEEDEIRETWTIVPIKPDPLLVNEYVTAIMGTIKDHTNYAILQTPINGIQVPAGLELPKTGSASFDNLLAGLIETVGMSPSATLEDLFRGDGVNPQAITAYELVPKRVLQLLLLAYYRDKPWENSGINLLNWETYLTNAIGETVAWLKRYSIGYVDSVDSDLVFFGYDVEKRQVYVLDPVLEKFFAAGGTAEAIYGLIYGREDGISSVRAIVDEMLAAQDELVKIWESRSLIRRHEARENWRAINERALKAAIASALEVTDPEELGLSNDRSLDFVRKECFDQVDLFFSMLTSEDIDLAAEVINIAGVAMCEPIGANMLTYIHNAINQDIDPQVAALDWTCDYILNYLLDGIEIHPLAN